MGVFENSAITDAGRVLLSHVQMGAIFTPTRIVIGSGNIPAGKTARTITEVTTPIKSVVINNKKRANDGTVIITGIYSNIDITADFYFRELALYAKAVYPDGTEISEILYSYGNAGSTADLIPAYTSGNPVERQIDLVTYIGNDAEVDLTIPSGVYLTQEALETTYFTDLVALSEDVTILEWADSCVRNTSKMMIGPTYASDAPAEVNGFLEVFVGTNTRKTVRFTSHGVVGNTVCFTRHIYQSAWTEESWSKDGDMLASVYDPNGNAKDIFKYCDDQIKAAITTALGGSY